MLQRDFLRLLLHLARFRARCGNHRIDRRLALATAWPGAKLHIYIDSAVRCRRIGAFRDRLIDAGCVKGVAGATLGHSSSVGLD